MTQEQLKEQFIEYAKNNMTDLTMLEGVKEILINISNKLYDEGFTAISNKLTTASLIINEIVKED